MTKWRNFSDKFKATVAEIAPKIGCGPDTLRAWVRRAETDSGRRDGVTTTERNRIKALERENRQLRQANEILKKASVYFAPALIETTFRLPRSGTELDRPFRK